MLPNRKDIPERVHTFGAHSAQPGVLLALSCNGEGVPREKNRHRFGVDEAVGEDDSQVVEGRSPVESAESDGLPVADEDAAIDLVADLGREVGEAEVLQKVLMFHAWIHRRLGREAGGRGWWGCHGRSCFA